MRANIYLFFIALLVSISTSWAQSESESNWTDGYNFGGGDGLAGEPYRISTEDHLRALAYLANVDTDVTRNRYRSAYYKLGNDIELTLEWALPIGTFRKSNPFTFTGNFDGQGYLISNIQIRRSVEALHGGSNFYYAGLFGVVHGTVKNLGVQGTISINSGAGTSRVGLLAACNESGSGRVGLIENCYAIGDVSYVGVHATVNMQDVGLLVGFNTSGARILNCYAVGTVTTNTVGDVSTTNINTGGLVGRNSSSTITNCYADVVVEAKHPSGSRGTLVGQNNLNTGVVNSYAVVVGANGNGIGSGTAPSSAIKPLDDINGDLAGLPPASWATSSVTGFYPYLGDMENRRTVTLDYTNHHSLTTENITINNGARVNPLAHNGYVWKKADGTTDWDPTESITANVTIKLVPFTYSLNFSAVSGIFEGATPTYTPRISFNENVPANLPDATDAKRIGYTLDGWTYNGGSKLTTSDVWAAIIGTPAPADGSILTLDAEWKANEYTLVFEAGVAGSFVDPINDITGVKYDEPIPSLPSLATVLVTNAGYENPKWTYDGIAITNTTTWEELLDTYTKANPSDEIITITADWLPAGLFITFDFKGGQNGNIVTPPSLKPARYNEPIDFWPLSMNRDGYVFKGWKSVKGTHFTSAADFWSSIVSADLASNNEIVLEAQWELAPTSLVPPGGGGSGSGSGGWYYMTIKSTFAGHATNVTYRVEGGRDFDFYVDMAGLEDDDILMVYANSKLLTPDYYDKTLFVVPSVNSNTTITINVEKRGQATSNELMSNTTNISVAMGTISIDVSKVSTIQIVSISGNVVYNNRVDGTITVNIPAGIYVVVVDGKTTKVVVR
jgi:The GLUG motif.